MVRYENLTHAHLEAWFGERGRGPTVKGVAAFIDDRMIAIAGFMLRHGRVLAFCGLKDEARPLKHHIHRAALRLMAEAKGRHARIVAFCDEDEPGAAKWLSRLGFREDGNGAWIWSRGSELG